MTKGEIIRTYIQTLEVFCDLIVGPQGINQILEKYLVQMIHFAMQECEYGEFDDYIFHFFSTFLWKHKYIKLVPSRTITFYVHIVLLKIIGLQTPQLKEIQSDPFFTANYVRLLELCYNKQENFIPRLINIIIPFIGFIDPSQQIRPLEQISSSLIKSTFLEKIFRWTFNAYKKKAESKDQFGFY